MLIPTVFGPALCKVFGDVNWIPTAPAFVKRRPITGDHRNGVLLPLDVRRHMFFPLDSFSFHSKIPAMVWRGVGFQPHRHLFLQKTSLISSCDAGDPVPAAALCRRLQSVCTEELRVERSDNFRAV